MNSENTVFISGKVSRLAPLRYTPAGMAIYEITLAVTQHCLGEATVGYFDVMVSGELAEDLAARLRIGKQLSLEGHLWSRTFRNRRGQKVSETKIVIDTLGGEQ